MVIKPNTNKIDVTITVRNSRDNAYNTKVTLNFTPNINYVKVEVRFLVLICIILVFLCCDVRDDVRFVLHFLARDGMHSK